MRTKRATIQQEKQNRKRQQLEASGESRYARKRKHLFSKKGERLKFGFEVDEPKPWK